MSCRQAYQRKDNSDGKGTEDTNAYRDSDGYRRSGSVLEWRNHLEDSLWVSDRGSGHYRPATYTYELCRSCTADSQTVRSWRLLLLAGEQSSVCSILFLTQNAYRKSFRKRLHLHFSLVQLLRLFRSWLQGYQLSWRGYRL
jgi:hypothetical protein